MLASSNSVSVTVSDLTCIAIVNGEVDFAASKTEVESQYTSMEESLVKLMKLDPYFKSISFDAEEVQTIGHLLATRDQAVYLATVEIVESVFSLHEAALERMQSLCSSLKTAATEWRAGRKALLKAKQLEEKAQQKEEERRQKIKDRE